MDTVKEKVNENNVDMIVVPGGCTKYIQALDVCWNSPFKGLVTENMMQGCESSTSTSYCGMDFGSMKRLKQRCYQIIV